MVETPHRFADARCVQMSRYPFTTRAQRGVWRTLHSHAARRQRYRCRPRAVETTNRAVRLYRSKWARRGFRRDHFRSRDRGRGDMCVWAKTTFPAHPFTTLCALRDRIFPCYDRVKTTSDISYYRDTAVYCYWTSYDYIEIKLSHNTL